MRAIYKGIDCGRLKRGDECEFEILGPMNVKASGPNFDYTFTYYEENAIEENWSVVNDTEHIG